MKEELVDLEVGGLLAPASSGLALLWCSSEEDRRCCLFSTSPDIVEKRSAYQGLKRARTKGSNSIEKAILKKQRRPTQEPTQ